MSFPNRIQDHAEIRAKQLKYWSEIAFSHFKKHGIWEASLQQIAQPSFTIFQEQNAYNSNACTLQKLIKIAIFFEISRRPAHFRGNPADFRGDGRTRQDFLEELRTKDEFLRKSPQLLRAIRRDLQLGSVFSKQSRENSRNL